MFKRFTASIVLSLLLLLMGGRAFASSPLFYPLPVEKPGGMVVASKILQDTQRGLWIVDVQGTLYFYDGLTLKLALDSQGHAIDNVQDAAMAGSKLWLVRGDAAYYYAPATTELLRLTISQIPMEYVASQGDTIWFASRRGVYKMQEDDLQPAFIPFEHPLKLRGLHIEGPSVFVAAQSGLYELPSTDQTVFQKHFPQQHITDVFLDTQGTLWFASLNGLFKGRDGQPVEFIGGRFDLPVSTLQQTDKTLWVGSKHGLFAIDLETQQQQQFLPSKHNDYALPGQRILDLERDKAGGLWISTEEGISYLPQGTELFNRVRFGNDVDQIKAHRINDVVYTSDGSYWLATDNGLFELSSSMEVLRHEPTLGHVDKISVWQQELWLLADKTVRVYSRKTHTWRPLALPHGSASHAITSLKVDHYGSLWLGMRSQLYRYWPDTQEWISFGQHWLKDPMGDESVTVIYEDSEYQIWVGTDYGLYQFEAGHLYLVNNTSSQGGVRDLYEDRMGQLWIAHHYGLQYSQTLSPLSLQPISLLGGRAYPFCIVGDNNGVWVSTTSGLSYLSFNAHPRRHFTDTEGLVPNEFSDQVCQRNDTGKLLFSSREGVVQIEPRTLLSSKTAIAPLALSEVRVNNTLHQLGGLASEPLLLPYGAMASFEFNITALKGQPHFDYRLVNESNVPTEWTTINSRFLLLEPLSPGNYLLEVKDSLFDGGEVVRYPFSVERPWFLSSFLIGGVLLVLGAIVLTTLYWRSRTFNEQNQQLKQAVYQKTAKIELQKKQLNASNMQLQRILEIRQNLMAQLSHELRTPLSLAQGMLAGLKEKLPPTSQLEVVEKNIAHSLHVAEQLLSCDALALIEPDKRCEQRVAPIIQACCISWQVEAEKKQIALCLEDSTAKVSVFLAPYHLEIMLGNLLSNALKYTDHKGGITVNVREMKSQLVISVSDTGRGMTEETKAHLFESYYQEEPVFSPEAGFGLGLSTVKQLVELYDGDISVISYQGVGSEFIIRLPIYRSEIHGLENALEAVDASEAKLKILIASADTSQKETWSSLLNTDYQLHFVADGYDALIAMQDHAPDMLIADLHLPGLTGTQLLQRLAEELPFDYQPRLILVTEGNEVDHGEVLMAGWAHAVLTKPLDTSQAFVAVSRLLHSLKESTTEGAEEEVVDTVWRDSVKALVAAHFHHPDFGTSAAAKALFMSERSLQRKFKQEFGIAFKDYVTQFRFTQAALMLKQGDRVADVALACGFNDPSYFSVRFKTHTGQTPTQFASGFVNQDVEQR
ncbi:helix-turn-helix domain-containing protein [Photobacterium japonica]|uniref:two-component regulator propeller domain-containing protein n=1 Tax=Photobacterium japonica TaxID=2910235 RepID=UPI003D0C8AA6